MKNAPSLYTMRKLRDIIVKSETQALTNEGWVPARPLGYYSLKSRIRITWMVFVGKADAFTWPGNQ
uniref:Uncharacterized protein n=1 Tax=viral metagenome TaxID=1070528 RepID=A0A6M3LLZ8_9ZZZZ